MEKTKFGISVAVVGAGLYFLGMYSFIPAFLLAAYVILKEDNEWLKKTAVKMIVVLLAFSLCSYFLSMIDYVFSFINVMVGWVGGSRVSVPLNLTNLLSYALSTLRILVMIVLGLRAFKMETMNLGPIDSFVNKAFGIVEEKVAKTETKTEAVEQKAE